MQFATWEQELDLCKTLGRHQPGRGAHSSRRTRPLTVEALEPRAVPANLSINSVSLNDGTSGTTNAVFTVQLDQAARVDIGVDYATADGTANAGHDYVATSGHVDIPAGST